MEWIVKIENNKNQRIRITFNPLEELIYFFGEARVKNNMWCVFSQDKHDIRIELNELQEKMEVVVIDMRRKLEEYENLDKGFSVLKLVAFNEDEQE